MLTFFGLTLSYRSNLFSQIHEILFYGQGGYDYDTVYHMPVWLRRFTYSKILEHYEKKNNTTNTVNDSIKSMKSVGAVNSPKVNVPSYVTKASKK